MLKGADLRGLDLSRARLGGADLSGANLDGANLSGANLSSAVCEYATFNNANLAKARLIHTNMDGATLTEACLWETQRAGWTIKGVICQSIHWDEKREKVTTYGPRDFERLFSQKTRIQIKYLGGITSLEFVTLPALIQHLEALHEGCKLRFESIQDDSGGALVSVVIDDDAHDTSPAQMEQLRVQIQTEVEHKALQLRLALREKEGIILRLGGQVQALQWTVDELLLNQKPNVFLTGGDVNIGDEFNVSGQAGSVGPNAHIHDITVHQIVSQLDKLTDFGQLANELVILRKAMTHEATENLHYIAVGEVAKAEEAAKNKDPSKVVESLKAAGQ
jgi:hypothetical protein